MAKSRTLCAVVLAALALSSAVQAREAVDVSIRDVASSVEKTRNAAQHQNTVVAEAPGWCYWHPYHCEDD